MTEASHLLQLLQTLTSSLDSHTSLEETHQRLTFAARDLVGGADQASLTVWHAGAEVPTTAAATCPLVWKLDELQYELKEGPCYGAVTDADLSVSADLARDERWPRYASRAVALGMRSQVSIRLRSETVVAGLNLYAAQPDAFAMSLPAVRLVRSHALVVLGYSQHLEALTNGLATRTLVGQAVGILMERHRLSQAHALDRLRRLSQHTNTKLHDVASSIVHPEAVG